MPNRVLLIALVVCLIPGRSLAHTVETFWKVAEEGVSVWCCTYHVDSDIVDQGITTQHEGTDGGLTIRNDRTGVETVYLFDSYISYADMLTIDVDGSYLCPDYPLNEQRTCLHILAPLDSFIAGDLYELIPSTLTDIEHPWCTFTASGIPPSGSGFVFTPPNITYPAICDQADAAKCSVFASCAKNTTNGNVSCTCPDQGFEDVHGDGSVCEDIDECRSEAAMSKCHVQAECHNTPGSFFCSCASGFVGDGYECSGDAWGVRSVFDIPEVGPGVRRTLSNEELGQLRHEYAMLVVGHHLAANASIVAAMPVSFGALHYGDSLTEVTFLEADGQLTLIALFDNKTYAEAAMAFLSTQDESTYWKLLGSIRNIADGPDLYRWSLDANQVNPTGLTVDRVYFEPSCLENGCWKVDVTYTAGIDNFNVFYVPKTDGDDSLSYDQSYASVDATWLTSPEDTFLPRKHPCTAADYQASLDPTTTPASVTACCIPQFLAMYRPVQTFPDAISGELSAALDSVCGTGHRARGVARSSIPIIARRNQEIGGNVYERPIAPAVEGVSGDLFPAEDHGIFVQGLFAGMPNSHISHTRVVDAYVGIYEATLTLDEVEVRTLSGILKGTVGVEHSVDTFVGLAEFSPTGQFVLDPFVTQVNIHLEKTNFFTVSTHGTNDYTFLEYVNMRLVAIYLEDNDFSGVGESGDRTVRTRSVDAAHYVQVTFTLGSHYKVNTNSGLIPSDSVRAGKGVFFGDASLEHKCLQYEGAETFSFDDKATFEARLGQACAPAAAMCSSPAAIPDSFVSFNVPLGIDFYDPPAQSLENNVFVDMVISAIDSTAEGGEAMQMKTTLTGSIPVVEGGVNIFCDGFTAKTDLKDVANADILVGSASTAEELSRLRIKKDIATTQLAPEDATQIDSASIEAGLMTLVLKGNASYFETNSGRAEVSIELEDVITIHIMDDDGAGADTAVDRVVAGLIQAPPSDNSDSNGLDTDGYGLNGAFYFTIDRSAQRAHLEPSNDLLQVCPLNPPRPSPGNAALETCVIRRDVQYREFPWRTGGKSTAMEICAAGSCPSAPTSAESAFLANVLGDSEYAKQLAVDYSNIIATAYALNGRYRRAFWINPGYEWTPAQTGGTPIFSVSQKLYLFALITLDEGIATDAGSSLDSGPGPNLRRRMLLQGTPDEALQDGQASVGADAFEFRTSHLSLMASAFGVPEDRVATFSVTLQLTTPEACADTAELQALLRETLEDHLLESASAFHTVQAIAISVERGSEEVECPARALGYTDSSATVTMMVVFKEGAVSTISIETFSTLLAVLAVEPLYVSDKVDIVSSRVWVRPSGDADETDSSSLPVALIAGAVSGAVALAILAAGAVLLMKRRNQRPVTGVVQTSSVHEVNPKESSQLVGEIGTVA